MAITSIGFQKTPGRPVEITFAGNTGLPNPNQTINLIGHMGPTGGPVTGGTVSGSATPYVIETINNVSEAEAGADEANALFGEGSELAKMVIAAIKANELEGASTFPQIICTPLAASDTDFGPENGAGTQAALAAAARVRSEFLVSCYDGHVEDDLTDDLIDTATLMSGAQRTQNGQYGTFAVAMNRTITDPSTLHEYDTQYFIGEWFPDTGTGDDAPEYSIGEEAAAFAATIAAGTVPFNPVDGKVMGGVDAPALQSDWITVGAGLESESALNRGWTPIRVLPNGDVAIVRSVTSRITTGDGETEVTAYYDVQDFQVLYFFRLAVVTRLNQPDMTRVKASVQTANNIRGEVLRIAQTFEDQGMFQNVDGLAKLFVIERNATDRSRFDIFVPVNVVPGLHVIATNVQATTEGDVFTA